MKQSNQLNLTLSDDVRRVLDEIETETGLPDQAIFKALTLSLIRSWALTKEFRTPMYIVAPDAFRRLGQTESAVTPGGKAVTLKPVKTQTCSAAEIPGWQDYVEETRTRFAELQKQFDAFLGVINNIAEPPHGLSPEATRLPQPDTLKARIATPQEPVSKLTKRSRK